METETIKTNKSFQTTVKCLWFIWLLAWIIIVLFSEFNFLFSKYNFTDLLDKIYPLSILFSLILPILGVIGLSKKNLNRTWGILSIISLIPIIATILVIFLVPIHGMG